MSLRWQLLLLQAVIVVLTVAGTGLLVGALQERQLREAYLDRMIGVAQSVAGLPTILNAYEHPDPSSIIQPIAEVIREASNVTYVVVTDGQGVRYSHPNPARIGEPVSTDPSVPLSGEMFVGTETGTLGESWRVKVPVFDDNGDVIGAVSVGILESELAAEFAGELPWLIAALGGAAVLGLIGSMWVTSIIRKRTYRLEPREIASLVSNRETMLHGLSEGVVVVDENGRIALVNDAALELLGLEQDDMIGAEAEQLLDPALIEALDAAEREGRLVLAGERTLIARSSGRRAEDGSPVAATLLLRDHTELHEALRQMDGARSTTEQLRAQAHEHANRLHVLRGLLDLGHVDEAREVIRREGGGGALGNEADDPLRQDAELSALVGVKLISAREMGITLECVTPNGEPLELADLDPGLRADLVTIVGNLLDNGVEAVHMGGHVRLELELDADVVVRCEDDGPGLPEYLGATVFEVGVSTKHKSQARLGRGIGLALVRRIVDRRGGRVETGRSIMLGGASIAVSLPRVSAPSPADPAMASGGSR